MDYIQAHVTAKPIPIGERTGKTFPPLLWPVIARALAKEPEDRYASAADFATAMQAVLAGATELPASLTPPPPVAIAPPPIVASVAPAPKLSPSPLARDPKSTKPEGTAKASLDGTSDRGTPIALLVGVAAACLVLGVLITVVAMKMFAR
jgi:serine/threonine-protein kinase